MTLTRQTSALFPFVSLFLFALCFEAIDGHAYDNPISLSELIDLTLPEVDVQKKAIVPNTEGSKVASIQLQAVERKINDFIMVLEKRLEDPTTSKPIQACLNQCQDDFADAIDGVKTSIESINRQYLHKANVDISAVATNVDTCNECFVEIMAEDPEIKTFDDWVRGVTGDCLVSLQKAPS